MPMVSVSMITLIVALVMPLLGQGRRLDASLARNSRHANTSRGVLGSYCGTYARKHPEHATCTGCTTLKLPDGGRCQWSATPRTLGNKCEKIRFGHVWQGYTTEPQVCPEEPKVAFDTWKERGGGQLHFIWWGNGGDKWLNSATASPVILAGAVKEAAKVHYWYDPSYEKLKPELEKTGLFTLHPLIPSTIHELAAAANLPGADAWNLINNLKAKEGNGLACAKNFISWMVLHSFGGHFFDTTVQILKPNVNEPPAAEELEAFKTALNEPVEHVTFPFSELRSRYKGKDTVFHVADPWTKGNNHLNRFPVYFNEDIQYTLLGNPELYGKVTIQPSDFPMPLPDLTVPSLDVWSIKAPRYDEALRTVVGEFFNRARRYGLVDGLESMIDFPIQLFGRDWGPGILLNMEQGIEKNMQSALTMTRKTTIGNHFDVRAVCLKSLSMMSLHAGLARATRLGIGALFAKDRVKAIRKSIWKRHVIAPATDWDIGWPVVAEWRMIKYSGQTHIA